MKTVDYWRNVGDDHYTCVAPPGYEIDPAVTAAIHEFDPGAIPLWDVRLWIPPGSLEPIPFVYHGIARYYPFPRQLRRPPRVMMPAVPTHETPNFLDAVFEDDTTKLCRAGGPSAYIPWGWNVYVWCRTQFNRLTAEAYDKLLERRRARDAAKRKAWQDDIAYRKKQIEPWILRKLEGVSDADWTQYQRFMADRDAQRAAGRDPGRIRPAKPFVILPGDRSPRSTETFGRVAPGVE